MVLLLAALPIGGAAAEGLKPIEYTLGDGTVVRFSGQFNMGVLHYDDGQDDFTNFVDNENSSSRVRFQIFSNSEAWKFESTLEAEYQPLASNVVSQLNQEPDWDFHATNIRKAEVAFANEQFGKPGSVRDPWPATGRPRSTIPAPRSSLIPPFLTAGGYFFRFAGDGLSDVTVGSSFSNSTGWVASCACDMIPDLSRVRAAGVVWRGRAGWPEQSAVRHCCRLWRRIREVDLDAAIAFSRNEEVTRKFWTARFGTT